MNFQKIGNDGRPFGEPTLAAFHDQKTGLMWASKDVSTERMTFAEAKRACSYFRCAGFNDWRLPTIAELETLRDLSRCDPAADSELGLKSAAYWSSTPLASSPSDCAWYVLFDYGGVGWYDQNYKAFVRAVRGSRAGQ